MKTIFEFTEIIDRVKKSLLINSDKELSERLGMKAGAFNARKKANSLPFEELLILANSEKIDFNWLLTGEGEMLKSQPLTPSDVIMGKLDADTAWEDFDLVPFYDVEASAGAGALVDQELKVSDMAFRKDWLRLRGLKATQCALIKARGDSMEPTIHDGDLLLVDRSVETIKDDAIYIIHADHHLIVKRIQQALDGTLIVISDNEKYVNQTIDAAKAEKIKVAGRVRWYGHEI